MASAGPAIVRKERFSGGWVTEKLLQPVINSKVKTMASAPNQKPTRKAPKGKKSK